MGTYENVLVPIVLPPESDRLRRAVAAYLARSSSYDWLVIGGARAQYKGTGEVTGLSASYDGTYKFILTAVDGAQLGGGAPDTFRMKIFRDDTVPYDNGPETPLEGGSIIIHK